MIYLKLFDSYKIPNNSIEVREFCENYLAYLLDDGFRLVIYFNGQKSCLITLLKDFNEDEDFFLLDDIKDIFIPFLEILSKEYNIKEEIVFNAQKHSKSLFTTLKYYVRTLISDIDVIMNTHKIGTEKLKSIDIFIEGNHIVRKIPNWI